MNDIAELLRDEPGYGPVTYDADGRMSVSDADLRSLKDKELVAIVTMDLGWDADTVARARRLVRSRSGPPAEAPDAD